MDKDCGIFKCLANAMIFGLFFGFAFPPSGLICMLIQNTGRCPVIMLAPLRGLMNVISFMFISQDEHIRKQTSGHMHGPRNSIHLLRARLKALKH